MNNIIIQFNANIIKKLKSHNLHVDYFGSALFIMFALDEMRYDLLDEFDDNNREKRAIILYRQLERRELLIHSDEDELPLFNLTKKGRELVYQIKKEFSENGIQVTAETLRIPVDHWATEYVEIFPKSHRSNVNDIVVRLDKFMKLYNFDKDTILGATKMYIKHQENSDSGHAFTRKAIFFIFKNEKEGRVSDLAAWCDKFLDKKDDVVDTSIMDLV